MYSVGATKQAEEQIGGLPGGALPGLLEVTVFLQVAPWNGLPFVCGRGDSPVRTRTFGGGGEGMVTYLIVEYRRTVEIVNVVWCG
ncbi:hypothetical protein ABGB17_28410 [Sphaerisporangium sp. B11E5]|uniref:hypothetical protein n=1 Tax=Sphaerisporangium sp. B11E5 TaxID=3153563 RepID=UPI00325F6258